MHTDIGTGTGKVVVIQFVTIDGVVEDPDGSAGTSGGGWAFRSGPPSMARDDFALGTILETGVLLLGRSTWEVFARRWPTRDGEFAGALNRMPKVVVSRSVPALDAWNNSTVLAGELVAGVAELARRQDVVVVGSTSVVHALAAADAVDEYRLLVVPTALGVGERLFVAPVDLRLTSVETVGEALLARYARCAHS
jgi:dihydrofolate reductase